MDTEKLGLEVVIELTDPDPCYSFDDLVVWKTFSGKLYFATDSGCSCPEPFENFHTIEDLIPITNETWDEFEKAVKDHCSKGVDKIEALAKVRSLLK